MKLGAVQVDVRLTVPNDVQGGGQDEMRISGNDDGTNNVNEGDGQKKQKRFPSAVRLRGSLMRLRVSFGSVGRRQANNYTGRLRPSGSQPSTSAAARAVLQWISTVSAVLCA